MRQSHVHYDVQILVQKISVHKVIDSCFCFCRTPRNCFSTYAETCFANFGDRVKNWITINEPLQTAVNGYGIGIFAPGRCERSNTEPYLVAHHQLLAHAAAVSVYRKKYRVNTFILQLVYVCVLSLKWWCLAPSIPLPPTQQPKKKGEEHSFYGPKYTRADS